MSAPVSIEAARAARRAPADPAETIRQMQAQQHALAKGLVDDFLANMESLVRQADELAGLGHVIRPGICSLARNVADSTQSHVQTARGILARAK